MSCIWGICNIQDKNRKVKICNTFEREINCFAIDMLETGEMGKALFGCGLQRLTSGNQKDMLPIVDKERGIIFTADCILDNREELIETLGLEKETPDGRVLYEAYLKWGSAFGDHVLGTFTFAMYDSNSEKVVLATDHMNTRSLYYCINDNELLFCTAVVPLAKAIGAKPSEKWAAACLLTVSADMGLYDNLTPYEGIYQLEAGNLVEFTNGRFNKKTYWDPRKIRIDNTKRTDNEYKKMFVDLFRKCVSDMLKVNGKKGGTLSGGLDSTAVTGLAATKLKKEKENYYSYTSVPLSNFDGNTGDSEDGGYAICDERRGVELMKGMYDNLWATYIPCENHDAFTDVERLIPAIGFPIKSGQNLTWLNAIYEKASQDGVKVMLKGQYGNSTVSYGTSLAAFYQDIRRGHFKTAVLSTKKFCKRCRIPKKTFVNKFLEELKGKIITTDSVDKDNILTDGDLLKKTGVEAYTNRKLKKSGGSYMDSRKQRLSVLHDPIALNQLGMFDTIMGLRYGLIVRDPTKDKRMVEFVASLPPKCMVAGGLERGQVRTWMEGYVPEAILKDINHRGLQSADYYFRVRKYWDGYKDKVIEALKLSELKDFADAKIVDRLVKLAETMEIKDIPDEDIRKINVLYSFATFLKTFDCAEK